MNKKYSLNNLAIQILMAKKCDGLNTNTNWHIPRKVKFDGNIWIYDADADDYFISPFDSDSSSLLETFAFRYGFTDLADKEVIEEIPVIPDHMKITITVDDSLVYITTDDPRDPNMVVDTNIAIPKEKIASFKSKEEFICEVMNVWKEHNPNLDDRK